MNTIIKKIILGIFLIIGVNTFSDIVDLQSSEEMTIKSGWCSGEGAFLMTGENGGSMRIHETCVINGKNYGATMVTYHGSDKQRLMRPVSNSKKIYFKAGSKIIKNVYIAETGDKLTAFQYLGNVEIK